MTTALSNDPGARIQDRKSSHDVPIEKLRVAAYEIPTDAPESDGTFAWRQTTLVLVHATAAGITGLGYSYADVSTAHFIDEHLKKIVEGSTAMDVPTLWGKMVSAIRNLGRPGVSSMAIAAVDTALWDLKARLLGLPLVTLLGGARKSVPVYGSGGFTSYSVPTLQKQLADWATQGIHSMKMKVGRNPDQDVARVQAVRHAVGDDVGLFVDANGAYERKQADRMGASFRDLNVSWFEEPVSSDDLEGLRSIRDHAPDGMDITAGEYGYDLAYFQRMLQAGAVDVLQADVTRCAGITEFLRVAALCDAWNVPLSAHCAPSLHRHVCCAAPRIRHVEYFHDHARIERQFFEGAAVPVNGDLVPDLSTPGMGLEFKKTDAARFSVYEHG